MVTYYTIAEGKIVPSTEKNAKIICYIAPTKDELQALTSSKYAIAQHEIDSSLDPDELGRMRKQSGYYAFILKTPCNYTSEDQLLFTVTSMGIFLFKDKLIVLSSEDLELMEYKNIYALKDIKDAFLSILYASASHFLAHIKVITMLSDSLEKRINKSMENHFLLNMFTLEKSLVFFVNGTGSNQVVIESIKAGAKGIGFTQFQEDILDEILIENKQCDKQAEIYSNILTGLMDARGSVVNNNLSVLIKRLTIVSVVFMPLNLIAGMGGMSEFSAMTLGIPFWISYPLFSIGLLIIGLTTFSVLKNTGMEKSGEKLSLLNIKKFKLPKNK